MINSILKHPTLYRLYQKTVRAKNSEYDFLKHRRESNLTFDELKALSKYRILCNEMVNRKIIISIPWKNTTLVDKKKQIKNFNKCLDKFYVFAKNYNWIDQSKATYDFWNEQHLC